MATGGTIPSNRTQSVSFYDTTGIIEKHKGIYFVPNDLGLSGKVNSAYLTKFEAICPPSSFYTNVSISSWSPQDRTLFVKGNVDDFRLVTEEGECLNYFIVTRNVTKGEGQSAVTKTYYYAFFITGIEQAGGGSIKITCEPDHFTNVFYLHNTDTLPQLDIFNQRLKNCYVKRQHYDRVILETESKTKAVSMTSRSDTPRTVILYESDYAITNLGYTETSHLGSGEYTVSLVHTDKYRVIGELSSAIAGNVYSVSLSLVFNEKVAKPTNTNIFLNQEESFKYKYQYRESKLPLTYAGSFTQSELNTIKNATSLLSLSQTLRNKVLKSCLAYVCVETKSLETVAQYAVSTTAQSGKIIGGTLIGTSTNMPNIIGVFPIFQIHSLFEHLFNINSSSIDIKLGRNGYYQTVFSMTRDSNGSLSITSKHNSLLNDKMGDYLFSAFIVKELPIPNNLISINVDTSGSTSHIDVRFDLSFPKYAPSTSQSMQITLDKNVYIGGIGFPETEGDSASRPLILYGDPVGTGQWYAHHCYECILLTGYNKKDISLTLDFVLPNLINNYYDPVLETEPYTFYSISNFSNYELAFNKNRYYSSEEVNEGIISYTVNLEFYTSINNAVKIKVVPVYEVEDSETKYFNEGLSYIVDSSLPIYSDSYTSFYYQNRAQMKNQYAVNDYNRGTDLLQHLFVSGPNAVGYSAGKGGRTGGGAGAGYSAILESGNQFAQMTDELIDWRQSTKVIEMNQKAKLADMGTKPDSIKQAGSDIIMDLATDELYFYINKYRIDNVSYNSIAKYLERFGYQVGLYDSLNTNNRVGWNFVMLNSVDLVGDFTVAEEEAIRNIFAEGVTLLHNKTYLTSGHNYETILND